ncbi:hypothetical protein KP509_23G028700 [Ceratopteris richardii]|uniref:Uncharacterized protein n=1 Tax=Ceratopteris richardii TaxID=49495 RepID=A0A8T2S0M4_CERRI|nr:hypothetical protein KP509_23G028700 [Ceratopteris richardii]
MRLARASINLCEYDANMMHSSSCGPFWELTFAG